jgi:hypothetical protein
MPHDFVGRIIYKSDGHKATVITETDSVYKVYNGNGIQLEFNRNSGILKKVSNSRGEIPFNNGPVLAEGGEKTGFKKLSYRYDADTLLIVEGLF